MRIGYARVSTTMQETEAQTAGLLALGVPKDRVYLDRGLTGRNRERPQLAQAMAACRDGDELVVMKLDRLARSVTDAHQISQELIDGGVKLNIGGAVHDPSDPVGKLLFSVLAMVAEFEADLISQRTKEGMAVARAKGRLKGRKPKLTPKQEHHLMKLMRSGDYSVAELAELFGVARATVYRAANRALETGTGG